MFLRKFLGKTGIRSANTLFQFPEYSTNKAVQLKFGIDPQQKPRVLFMLSFPITGMLTKNGDLISFGFRSIKEDNGETATASMD